jgi:hypothetical protein
MLDRHALVDSPGLTIVLDITGPAITESNFEELWIRLSKLLVSVFGASSSHS